MNKEDGSLFSAFKGRPAESPAGESAAERAPKSQVDELERRLTQLEDDRRAEKAAVKPAPPAEKGPDPVKFLDARLADLERRFRENLEKLTALDEGLRSRNESQEILRSETEEFFRFVREIRRDEADEKAREARLAGMELRVGGVEKSLENALPELERASRSAAEAASGLEARLKQAEGDIARLAPETRQLISYVAMVSDLDARLSVLAARMEKIDEKFPAIGERFKAAEDNAARAALDLRAAWDMINMLEHRTEDWESRFQKVEAELGRGADALQTALKELTVLSAAMTDVSGKGAVAWTRVAALEKEFQGIKSRICAVETERKETMSQVRAQGQGMQAVIGKLLA